MYSSVLKCIVYLELRLGLPFKIFNYDFDFFDVGLNWILIISKQLVNICQTSFLWWI